MQTAWSECYQGSSEAEATFRLDGSLSDYQIIAAPKTREFSKQTGSIIAGKTFALFHVHPNRAEPTPSQSDRNMAHKYRLKIYTMHQLGLYEYDPVTKKATQLRKGLGWMKPMETGS